MSNAPFDDLQFVNHPILGGFFVSREPEPGVHPPVEADTGVVLDADYTIAGQEPAGAPDPAPASLSAPPRSLAARLARRTRRHSPERERARAIVATMLEESRAQMQAELSAWKATLPSRPAPSPAVREHDTTVSVDSSANS
jgi:hypothetical protein